MIALAMLQVFTVPAPPAASPVDHTFTCSLVSETGKTFTANGSARDQGPAQFGLRNIALEVTSSEKAYPDVKEIRATILRPPIRGSKGPYVWELFLPVLPNQKNTHIVLSTSDKLGVHRYVATGLCSLVPGKGRAKS